MENITVLDSTEITSYPQLKEIFRDHCGVKILGIVFLDWHDILSWYDIVINDEALDDETDELSRIAELCWEFVEEKYHFKD